MISLRRARLLDAPWLVQASYRFAQRTEPRYLPADANECGHLWLHAIANDYVVIAEDEDVPVGFVYAQTGQHHFNPALRVLTCLMWYVEPANTRAALMLLNAFVEHGEAVADVTYFDLLTPVGERTLERLGFSLIERNYARWTRN